MVPKLARVNDITMENERHAMYAIVKTGGKQYRVAANDVIEVEKLAAEPGDLVELEVVFIADGSTVTTDADALAKAKVFATVVEQFKGDKQIIFKFKKRKGYKRLKGHRQNLTKLQIEAISLDGKAPKVSTAKKTEAKPAASEAKAEKKPAAKTAAKTAAAEKPAKDEAAEKKPATKKTAAKATADAEEKPKATKKKTEAVDAAEDKPKKKTTKKSEEDKTKE